MFAEVVQARNEGVGIATERELQLLAELALLGRARGEQAEERHRCRHAGDHGLPAAGAGQIIDVEALFHLAIGADALEVHALADVPAQRQVVAAHGERLDAAGVGNAVQPVGAEVGDAAEQRLRVVELRGHGHQGELLGRVADGLAVGVVEAVVDLQRIACREPSGEHHRVDVLAAKVLRVLHRAETGTEQRQIDRLPGDQVLADTVVLIVQVGNLQAERTPCGQVQVGAAAKGVAAAEGHLLLQAEFAARCRGGHADCAGSGVSAKQRALRTAQYLDTLDVGKIEDRADRATDIDAIQVHADLGVDGVVGRPRGDAADGHQRDRAYALVDDVEVRCERVEVLQIGDAVLAQHVGTECGDGDRYLLQVLLALLRSDDDLLQPRTALGCGGLLRHGEGRACQGKTCCGDVSRETGSFHGVVCSGLHIIVMGRLQPRTGPICLWVISHFDFL